MEKKTSTLSNSLIWFGAGISIAEIITGAIIAPLGLFKGIAAIILGHLIGFALMFFVGLIGAQTEKSSMETVKIPFGSKGALLFSVLNVIQLVGWTAIMIKNGAVAASSVFSSSEISWCVAIGALIILWIAVGFHNLEKINYLSMGALFILSIILCIVCFKGNALTANYENMSFGSAVELSLAMPLSWLPLISDYTKTAKKPFSATLWSSISYFAASTFMYIIGLGAALFAGNGDIALIMTKAGLGVAALLIIIFSTVTTTFLDAYSAGVSTQSIFSKLREKPMAILVCIVGTLIAIFTNPSNFEGFLYFIGSVFAPMAAIQITDWFILKKTKVNKSFDFVNLSLWFTGFIIYRIFMNFDIFIVGYTLPVMVITALLSVAVNKFRR